MSITRNNGKLPLGGFKKPAISAAIQRQTATSYLKSKQLLLLAYYALLLSMSR